MFRSIRASHIALVAVLSLLLGVCCVDLATNLRAQESPMMMKAPDFHVLTPSNYDFNDTLDTLKTSIESHNLMVVAEINPQQMLRMVGVQTKGMRQLFYFHPRYMKELLETNKNATIEAPLKFVIMEMPNGKTMVRHIKPSTLFERYDDERLEAFGKEMDRLAQEIAASVTE